MEYTEIGSPRAKGYLTNRSYCKRQKPKLRFCFLVTSSEETRKKASISILNNEVLHNLLEKENKPNSKKVHNVHLSQPGMLHFMKNVQKQPKTSLSFKEKVKDFSGEFIQKRKLSNFNSKYYCLIYNKSNSQQKNTKLNHYFQNASIVTTPPRIKLTKSKSNFTEHNCIAGDLASPCGIPAIQDYFKKHTQSFLPNFPNKLSSRKISLKSLSQSEILKQML